MSFFEIVFDPASFAGGAAVSAVVFSGKSIRARIQANGVVAKAAKLSAQFKPQYAELEKKLAAADERISAFAFDYHAAYPSGQKNPVEYYGIQSARDRVRENLNLMLTMLNALDNSHLSSKTINEYWTRLDTHSRLVTSAFYDVDTLLERHELKLRTSIEKIASLKKDAQILGENLKNAQSDYADALTRFDRLFLDSVPPALFKAEKACEAFIQSVKTVVDNVENGRGFAARDSCSTQRSVCMKAMTTMRNHLDRVMVYSDVAKSEAAKHRVLLRQIRTKSAASAQRGADYDAALESLMEAESRPYDKGNPQIEFEETIKPFYTFVYNASKGVYKR
jgi:hypothetical protein